MQKKDPTYQKLLSEFNKIKRDNAPIKSIQAIVILSGEEIEIEGETGERAKKGISIAEKNGNSMCIYLGTKLHNASLKRYLEAKKSRVSIVYPIKRLNATTRTQIKDLIPFLIKNKIQSILFISHAYHIPRLKRYLEKYDTSDMINAKYWPLGNIENQSSEVEEEIEKIMKYFAKGDLPLFI